MRLHLIACEIFFRELCTAVARSPHRIDLTFLPKGLHDLPSGEMAERVQVAVDSIPSKDVDAIVLGYGLCNNGLASVTARDCPLIVPRAHDCITLFLGSCERYREVFDTRPGSYFLTSGWIERGETSGELADQSIQHKLGMDRTMQELIEQYGEDNAQYLFETLCQGTRNYERIIYIPMGVEPSGMEEEARDQATSREWAFETCPGNMRLIDALACGDWNEEEFLTVPPGASIHPSHDDAIVRAT